MFKKYIFICMDKDCLEHGHSGCRLEIFSEGEPEWPSYCPYELEPASHKMHPWMKARE